MHTHKLRERVKTMNDEDLKKVREFLIANVFRNPDIVLSCVDIARGDVEGIDFVDLIASLYDMLHLTVTGEHYDYMWHWCNKVGGWCDDLALYKLLDIKDKEGQDEKERLLEPQSSI